MTFGGSSIIHCVNVVHHTHSGFFDLSQLSRASLLKAAVAALLLLFRWMLAMVSELFTTSMSPILFPVDKQPYGIILCEYESEQFLVVAEELLVQNLTAAPTVPEIQAFFLPQILHELYHLEGQHVLSKI